MSFSSISTRGRISRAVRSQQGASLVEYTILLGALCFVGPLTFSFIGIFEDRAIEIAFVIGGDAIGGERPLEGLGGGSTTNNDGSTSITYGECGVIEGLSDCPSAPGDGGTGTSNSPGGGNGNGSNPTSNGFNPSR